MATPKIRNSMVVASQLFVIAVVSLVSAVFFWATLIHIREYAYVAYISAAVLYCTSLSRYKSYLGLLPLLSFLPLLLAPELTLELFIISTPLLMVGLGFATVLLVPATKGKEFLGFAVALLLPVLLAQSKIDWGTFFHHMVELRHANTVIALFTPFFFVIEQAFSLLEGWLPHPTLVYIAWTLTVCGYIYLRQSAETFLLTHDLTSRGGATEDTKRVGNASSLLLAGLLVVAVSLTALLAAITPMIAGILTKVVVAGGLHIFLLGIGLGGTVMIATVYTFAWLIARFRVTNPNVTEEESARS